MLGVEFPICAFSHCRDVVAAVSNAGGFGVLGAVAHSPERLDSELTWIEEQTGGKPYGVDLLLPPKYVGAEQGGIDAARARELLGAGVIRDGMIPKVEAAIRATDGGCATHIIDARVPHALLLELLTERGVGTMLTRAAPA